MRSLKHYDNAYLPNNGKIVKWIKHCEIIKFSLKNWNILICFLLTVFKRYQKNHKRFKKNCILLEIKVGLLISLWPVLFWSTNITMLVFTYVCCLLISFCTTYYTQSFSYPVMLSFYFYDNRINFITLILQFHCIYYIDLIQANNSYATCIYFRSYCNNFFVWSLCTLPIYKTPFFQKFVAHD